MRGPAKGRTRYKATRYDFILAPMLTIGFHARLAAFYRFGGFLMTIASKKSKAGDVLAANNVQTRLGEQERMIGRNLAISIVLALTSFLVAVLIGHLCSRYAQETAALGFSGIYERFQAWQAGFLDDQTEPNLSAPGKQGSSQKRPHDFQEIVSAR
jgi:hypothetical protein